MSKFLLGLVGFLALAGLIVFMIAYEPVGAGEVRVVRKFGKTNRTLHPGLNWINPFTEDTVKLTTKLVIYETTSGEKQKDSFADYKDYPVDTNTSDGQQVDIYYTIRFAIDGFKAEDVVNRVGNMDNVVERIVKTESRIKLRNIPRQFTAEALYQGDGVQEVQRQAEEQLRPIFEQNGLYLDAVGVREIKFTDQYVSAIEAKQIEAVNVETARNTAEKAKFEKEAEITRAEAQAQSQELQKVTLSDQVLRKLWIEKWNGSVPNIITGNDANLFIQP